MTNGVQYSVARFVPPNAALVRDMPNGLRITCSGSARWFSTYAYLSPAAKRLIGLLAGPIMSRPEVFVIADTYRTSPTANDGYQASKWGSRQAGSSQRNKLDLIALP